MGSVTSHAPAVDECIVNGKASSTVSFPDDQSQSFYDANNLFTAKEKHLLRKTWMELQQQPSKSSGELMTTNNSQNVDRGIRVFLRIFELEPEAQSLFRDFQHANHPSQLINSPVFRSHAMRFMTAVEMTVRNLDALDVSVTPTLVRLGRRHADFVGFHPRYMAVFERAMDDAWLTDLGRRRYDRRTRSAWCKLFHFLTSRVAEGYNEALTETSSPRTSAAVDEMSTESAIAGQVSGVHEI